MNKTKVILLDFFILGKLLVSITSISCAVTILFIALCHDAPLLFPYLRWYLQNSLCRRVLADRRPNRQHCQVSHLEAG